MLNKSVLFIFPLICCISETFAGSESTTEGTRPVMESLWFCSTIKPNVDMVVTSSELTWGKWISGPSDFQEISSPNGQHAIYAKPLRICSAGRYASPSGTEGYAWLATPEGKKIEVTWNYPLLGAPSYAVNYDHKEFVVTSRLTGAQSVDHFVRKLRN